MVRTRGTIGMFEELPKNSRRHQALLSLPQALVTLDQLLATLNAVMQRLVANEEHREVCELQQQQQQQQQQC
jgi:hypothetical protein